MSEKKERADVESGKRIYVNLDSGVVRKIDALKALCNISRDDVVTNGINDLYTKKIHSLAKDEGIVQETPSIEIRREMFNENQASEFDNICTTLGIRDTSINSIVLKIQNFHSK